MVARPMRTTGRMTLSLLLLGLVAGVAASIVPALRAASVDPLKALRQD